MKVEDYKINTNYRFLIHRNKRTQEQTSGISVSKDYYYEEMPLEEAIEKIFIGPESSDKILRNHRDVDTYIRDNLNVKVPLDGPLCRIYMQRFEPDD